MKIKILCIGSLKASPELTLIQSYLKRMEWAIHFQEIEGKAKSKGTSLKEQESKALLRLLPEKAYGIALDERGNMPSSLQFAEKIQVLQGQGVSSLYFLIGGADGHAEICRERADWILSLGPMTWPHKLIRVMLLEQLYRAQQILKNHPYHRE